MNKLRQPFYIMFHPIEGYEEMRWNKSGSIEVSCLILIIWFMTEVIEHQLTGFIFNHNRPYSLNPLLVFSSTIIAFLLFTGSNWAFTTLMDGEGSFENIVIYCAYALVPYIIVTLVVVVLSRELILQEGIFLSWLKALGILWSMVLVFCALAVVHQYSYGKALGSIFLTLIGMLIILFIAVLIASLFQQVAVFLRTIYNEMMYRL